GRHGDGDPVLPDRERQGSLTRLLPASVYEPRPRMSPAAAFESHPSARPAIGAELQGSDPLGQTRFRIRVPNSSAGRRANPHSSHSTANAELNGALPASPRRRARPPP